MNYKQIVENFKEQKEDDFPKWDVLKSKIESNYSDGEVDGDTVHVYVESLVSAYEGWRMNLVFCEMFGLTYDEQDLNEMESMYFDAEQLESEFADWLDEHKPKSFPAGSFYVDCHEGSGDKTLFFGADKKELPFSEWRISEAYQEREDMRHDMLCDGESEDAISEAWKAIEVEYEAYCESNKYATNYDE